jgi:hypothetical protein
MVSKIVAAVGKLCQPSANDATRLPIDALNINIWILTVMLALAHLHR